MTARSGVSVVSPYRAAEEPVMTGSSASALSWYTHELAREMAELRDVVIIAPKRGDETIWHDGNVRVLPAYRRGHPAVAFQIARAIAPIPGVVHLQHELYAYGNALSAFSIPVMMTALRRMGHNVVTTVHGIIPLESIDTTFLAANEIGRAHV